MKITSCAELLNIIYDFEEQGHHYYRGFQNASELISSLGRHPTDDFAAIKKFALLLIQNGFPAQTFEQLISIAQHYGMPTNLIDLTVDPFVALFFGLGQKKLGKFQLLCVAQELFHQQHSKSLRPYMTALKDVDDLETSDLDKLTLSQMDMLAPDTKLNKEYITCPLFNIVYNKFYQVQLDYTLVPYIKSFNIRIEKQKGLFVMAKDCQSPLPLNWFYMLEVDLGHLEAQKLIELLTLKGYTSDKLLPSEIAGVNIENLARNSLQV